MAEQQKQLIRKLLKVDHAIAVKGKQKCSYQESQNRILTWLVNLQILQGQRQEWSELLIKKIAFYYQCKQKIFDLFVLECQSYSYIELKQKMIHQKNVSLYELIQKDCLRTFSKLCYFTKQDTSSRVPFMTKARKQKIRQLQLPQQGNQSFVLDHLCEMLFIFARMYPEIGYVQGMSDILAVLFYELNQHQHYGFCKTIPFIIFCKLSSPMEIFWKEQVAHIQIKAWLSRLQKHLSIVNSNIATKLLQLQIATDYFAIKWLMTFFSQSFKIRDVVRLWDFFFADFNNFLDRIQLVSITIITINEKQIMKRQFNEILQCLQNCDEIAIQTLIKKSIQLQSKFKKHRHGHSLHNFFGYVKHKLL